MILVIRRCFYMWFDHKNLECADSGVWKCVRRGAAKRARASVVQLPARNAIMALRHFWPRKILLTQTHAFLLRQEGKYDWSREGLSDLCDYWKFINLSSHIFWLESNSVPKTKLDQVYCAWLIKWIIKGEIIQLCLTKWWIISGTSRYWVSIRRYWLVFGGTGSV